MSTPRRSGLPRRNSGEHRHHEVGAVPDVVLQQPALLLRPGGGVRPPGRPGHLLWTLQQDQLRAHLLNCRRIEPGEW